MRHRRTSCVGSTFKLPNAHIVTQTLTRKYRFQECFGETPIDCEDVPVRIRCTKNAHDVIQGQAPPFPWSSKCWIVDRIRPDTADVPILMITVFYLVLTEMTDGLTRRDPLRIVPTPEIVSLENFQCFVEW